MSDDTTSTAALAIRYEQTGAVVLITIDRPAQLNAINSDVRAGLFAAFRRFEADDSARVAILTGAGAKAFCAGMDLKEAAEMSLAVPPKGFLPIIGQGLDVTKPTIAAVNGFAFAGGWLLAQMCDLCVAAEHATFGITEARVGRGMPWAAPQAVVERAGLHRGHRPFHWGFLFSRKARGPSWASSLR